MNFVGVIRSLIHLTLLAAAGGVVLLGVLAFPATRAAVDRAVVGQERLVLFLAWIVAAVATGGSLYFSEVVGFPPCVLCWYQRIAMYPQVLILAVAFLACDGRVWRYVLPLSLVGFSISSYHVLLQNLPTVVPAICDAAASCTVRYIAGYGFVSIPVMAGSAFLLLAALSVALKVASSGRHDGTEP